MTDMHFDCSFSDEHADEDRDAPEYDSYQDDNDDQTSWAPQGNLLRCGLFHAPRFAQIGLATPTMRMNLSRPIYTTRRFNNKV